MTETSDLLDAVIPDEEGWEKIPTFECGCPIDLGFFIDYKEEGGSIIYKIEDSTTVSFEIDDNGLLETSLNLNCHKASVEEIKEYEER